jgi:hypothetical protein
MYLPFTGGAVDATGNGYDGVVYGATLSSDRFGNPNSAYLFNGVDNYIQLTKNLPDMASMTLSAWVFYTSGSFENGRGDIFTDSDLAASQDFQFGVQDSTDAIIVATKAGCTLSQNVPLGENILNRWVHLTWVVTSEGSWVYVNGSQVFATTQGGANIGLHAPPLIGANSSQSPWVAFFGGKIDEFRIYSRALSASEIQELYQSDMCPTIGWIPAFQPYFCGLTLGAHYQLQASADALTWTNVGAPFKARETSMTYPQYWNENEWRSLSFRLQLTK